MMIVVLIYLLKKDCSIHDSPHKINQYTRRPGDQIGSGMFVAKKLVDSFCATAIMGHVHTGSMFTKVSQVKTRDKSTSIRQRPPERLYQRLRHC
jgi:hypothetical protein